MPNLTTKELDFLTDLMKAEQLAVKKLKHYASQVSDPQLRTKFEQAAALHQNHYNTLLNQLG